LVIANYSMAVTSRSDPNVVKFYQQTFPSIYPSIQVNEMHSQLIDEIVRRNPGICFVDTHPALDGEHRKFIDLVHFAPEGDRQMAEAFWSGMADVLKQDLKVSLETELRSSTQD
jgi:hypothetical protein